MSLFKKLFGGGSKPQQKRSKPEPQEEVYEQYLPECDIPADERFIKNFISNGGKFLYCLTMDEVHQAFDQILLENDWYEKKVFCGHEGLKQTFSNYNLLFDDVIDAEFVLTTCEGLVADNGSILLCSNQLGSRKLDNLPKDFIVYATASQIMNNLGEGMALIQKQKTDSGIPSNLTSINNFDCNKAQDDNIMSSVGKSKNLYLLLLEDL